MSELTGRSAQTIHRLLEAGMSDDHQDITFRRDEDDPLEEEEEVPTVLRKLRVFAAVDRVRVGDDAAAGGLTEDLRQAHGRHDAAADDVRKTLPGPTDGSWSASPTRMSRHSGRMARSSAHMSEMSTMEHSSRMTASHSSGSSSSRSYAHAINRGEHPKLSQNSGDFFFLRRADPQKAADTVVELCRTRLPNNMKIPPSDIQVLTPTRKYDTGMAALNVRLQAALNPPSPEKKERRFGETVFREGDRVMQIRQ